MDEVAKDLFVGTAEDASDASTLRDHDIAVIVSLTHTGPVGDVPAEVTLVDVPMMDGPQNSPNAFETAVGEVLSRLDAGDVTLVHCSAGASRSPAVAGTALALHTNSNLTTVFEQIQDRRPVTDPHEALLRQAATVYTSGRELVERG
jgi:atypical dual specificity phosphatase